MYEKANVHVYHFNMVVNKDYEQTKAQKGNKTRSGIGQQTL